MHIVDSSCSWTKSVSKRRNCMGLYERRREAMHNSVLTGYLLGVATTVAVAIAYNFGKKVKES